MVVCTVTEVYLLLITENENGLLLSKSDFVYQLDTEYLITAICSTAERRIFLGSQNDYLYELEYAVFNF
jgi:hypothetical protein